MGSGRRRCGIWATPSSRRSAMTLCRVTYDLTLTIASLLIAGHEPLRPCGRLVSRALAAPIGGAIIGVGLAATSLHRHGIAEFIRADRVVRRLHYRRRSLPAGSRPPR